MWKNKQGKVYKSGALKTANGVIFNPTVETLAAHGFEPYEPPAQVQQVLTAEEISELRKAAYITRVDPITCEIERLKEMDGTFEEIEAARNRRAEVVAAIKSEYPYPET